ncbi:nuclear transport factor 2 family protein [Gracilimonas sp.]|uniref:nuclear transport factor 2 family protein n=1 Tax=Gracilimonas sp. TaxID=1974203 RepID=UPI0032EC0AC9
MDPKKQTIQEYFRKIDSGNTDYLNLFTQDVNFFFPKFGTHQGVDALRDFQSVMSEYLNDISHDLKNFNYISQHNTIVVEGTENGTLKDGTSWPNIDISTGRFCSVFEFRSNQISRMFIYVDPDYASLDQERVQLLKNPSY